MPSISEIRQQFPQYSDLGDTELALRLHQAYYADMPMVDYLDRVGLNRQTALYETRQADNPLGTYLRQQLEAPGTSETPAQAAQRAYGSLGNQNTTGTAESVARAGLQGSTLGWGDELVGAGAAGIASLTGMYPGQSFGDLYEAYRNREQGRVEQFREDNPVVAYGTEIAASIPTAIAAGGGAVGNLSSLGARALASAGVGAAQGAVYGAGAANPDERWQGARTGGIVGTVLGGLAPVAGNWLSNRVQAAAQNRATNAAIQSTPSAEQLRASAGSMFDQVRDAGTEIAQGPVRNFVTNAGNVLRGLGADRDITPAGLAVFRRMVEDLQGPVGLQNIHVWRQLASNAAMSSGGDQKMGNTIIRMLDDFVENLRPSDLVVNNPALGQGAAGPLNRIFLEAISTYRRAAKMGTLENAIRKAAEYQSGFESGLRNQFSNILRSDVLSRGFSEAEKQAMRRVSRGTTTGNILRLLGTFGVPTDQARNWLGVLASGSIGTAMGGLPGAAAMLGLGTAARAASGRIAQNAADRAVRVVGTPNIPQVPPVNPAIPSPLEVIMRQLAGPTGGHVSNL